jgi:hypothetical protein
MSNNLTPAKAEATDQPVSFSYDGKDYTISPSSEWSLDALEAFEDEKVIRFVRLVLGPVQWAAFKSTSPKVQDFNDFMEALGEASGISGN